MKIGIDIDDTICSTWEIIIKEMCKEFNLNYEEAIKSKKAYNDLINLSQEDYLKYSKEKFKYLIQNPKLKPNVKEIIDLLRKENEIIFITARNDECYINAYEYTKKFLENNNIYYDKLIVGKMKKGKICKQENIDIFIDDSINNCKDVSNENIKVLLFENYYNEYCNEFPKVKNWNEVLEIIKGELNERKANN